MRPPSKDTPKVAYATGQLDIAYQSMPRNLRSILLGKRVEKNMTSLPIYKLPLHKTYYDKGFFNLGVDIERFVRSDSGPVKILLGNSKSLINGRIDREANQNGTPRVFGGAELQHWLQRNFQLKDVIDVHIVGPNEIWISGRKKNQGSQDVQRTGPEATRSAAIKPVEKAASKAFQRVGSKSNAHVGRDFEELARRFFADRGITLSTNHRIAVGIESQKKKHAFDLGSSSPKVIVECKSHTWTAGNNVPSAKLTVWNEAMYYFAASPPEYRKIFFVLRDERVSNGETLAEYYIRMYSHLIPSSVEIWEYDTNRDEGQLVKEAASDVVKPTQ